MSDENNKNEIVCAVKGDSIMAVIASMNIPDEALVLLEEMPQRVIGRTERAELLRFAYYKLAIEEPVMELERYTSGRLFCPAFELRWQRQGGKLRMVYTGEKQTAPAHNGNVLTVQKSREGHYILFGKRHPYNAAPLEKESTLFSDVRIPRLLSYPIEVQEVDKFVRLRTYEYLSTQGEVEASRFVELEKEPVEKEQQKR